MTSKRKILVLSDHPLSTSGVGTQARWLINGLLATGKYSFRCLGGAIKHDSYDTIAVDGSEDFIIKPTDGFGDRNMLRQILAMERPDALLLFTDPRFFIWVWEMEDEVHQICPIVYNHLWDNGPYPSFNRVLYESTDVINCINWPTFEMLSAHFPDRTNFIPHAVPSELYFPLPRQEAMRTRAALFGHGKEEHFIGLYVGRNARRKMPSDIIWAWKLFMDRLQSEEGHRRALLVMHTDPLDHEGANLHHVIEMANLKGSVAFSADRIDFKNMNLLYNSCDVVLNRSCNEGFGLPILEGLMAGRPAIAIKTGGLTRQIVNHETGEQHGIALDPTVSPLVGNQMVPFIREDFVSDESYSNAIWQIHKMGADARGALGSRARHYVLREFSMERLVTEWDRTLTGVIDGWKTSPRKNWRTVTL